MRSVVTGYPIAVRNSPETVGFDSVDSEVRGRRPDELPVDETDSPRRECSGRRLPWDESSLQNRISTDFVRLVPALCRTIRNSAGFNRQAASQFGLYLVQFGTDRVA